jgi:hypothetical protein
MPLNRDMPRHKPPKATYLATSGSMSNLGVHLDLGAFCIGWMGIIGVRKRGDVLVLFALSAMDLASAIPYLDII